MGLFRKSEERVAQNAAAEEEFDRLCALPPADLAAAIMAAFAPNAGLAERTGPHGDLVKTTRLGEAALADGTVAQQLAG